MNDLLCVAPRCANHRPEHQWLCVSCVQELRQHLASVPALVEELNITLSRQDRMGPVNRGGAETAVPFKVPAGEALWVLTDTLTSWVRVLVEDIKLTVHPFPATAALAARWLERYATSIAMHEAAGEAVDEIASAVDQAYRVIDRPMELVTAGRCGHDGCEAVLYARPDAREVTCQVCGSGHDMADRRAWMTAQLREHEVTAAIALGWIEDRFRRPVPNGTWRSWVSRQRISPVRNAHVGVPLYRFGDCLDLATDWIQAVMEREARAGSALSIPA